MQLTEDADLGKIKNIFSNEFILYWRVCKQAKLLHLRPRKPTRLHWKAEASKTGLCLVRIWIWARSGRCSQWRSLSVHVEWMFVHKNWRKGYWQHLVSPGLRYVPQQKLQSMFCALVLNITLSAAELMSFGHLGAAIWQRWTIICGVSSKTSITSTSQRQLTH